MPRQDDPWAPFREARLAKEQAARDAIAMAQKEAAEEEAELLASLKGEQGDKGEQGETGEPGPPGRDGRDGVDGVDGRDGADGAPGADGHDGTDGRPGLDGAPGVPGPPGARGPRGIPGASMVSSEFRRDTGQRIAAVVELLDDGTERTFTVQRDAAGRPVGMIRG